MKIWHGYGSEHSANLVMVARFQDVAAAEAAKRAIERLGQYCTKHLDIDAFYDNLRDSYPDDVLDLLIELHISSIRPAELEQLLYDYRMSIDGDTVKIETNEVEVSSFLKIFLSKSARIEVYSARPNAVDESGQSKS